MDNVVRCTHIHILVITIILTDNTPMAQQPPSGPGLPHCRGSTIMLRHTTLGRTPLDELSARRRDLYLTTHNTHKKHSCSGGIRTRNPSKRAAAGPCLRPRGHWDRHQRGLAEQTSYG
jgi:hypothetical protein